MKYLNGILLLILVVAAMLLMESSGLAQCAMCRTALENSVEGRAISDGLEKGILFLLATPYAIMGGIGFGVFRALRKSKADALNGSAPESNE